MNIPDRNNRTQLNPNPLVREAVVRAIVRAAADGSALDSEDLDRIISYGVGDISYEELMAASGRKMQRLLENA